MVASPPQRPQPPPTFGVRLATARPLSASVRELTFERADGEPIAFLAGQWMNFVLPIPDTDGTDMRRAYSIASAPIQEGLSPSAFQIAVTRVAEGPGSVHLHELPVGASLTAIGPQGFFTRPRDAKHPSLFVGTGTGVTPLRSMIRDALTHGSKAPLLLVFGVRTEADRIYVDEFEALAKAHENFRVEFSISKPPPSWTGRSGYVQTHVPELWAELVERGPEAPHAYICGLERMVSAVREVLRGPLGVERKQVHSERYD